MRCFRGIPEEQHFSCIRTKKATHLSVAILGGCLASCAFEVSTVARIDDEEGILFDEEGDLDFETGFEFCAFGGGCNGIALDGGFTFDDAQGDGVRNLDADGIAVVQLDLDVVIFADELQFVFDHFGGNRELFVGVRVHEDVVLFIFIIEILAGNDFEVGDVHAIFSLVGFLEDLLCADVLCFEFDERSTAACGGGLYSGFEDSERIAVHQKKETFFEIDCCWHENSCV